MATDAGAPWTHVWKEPSRNQDVLALWLTGMSVGHYNPDNNRWYRSDGTWMEPPLAWMEIPPVDLLAVYGVTKEEGV